MSCEKLHIGTCGWNYRHWADGVFYPLKLPQKSRLSYYCRIFETVEINNTFYNLPAKKVFENWRTTAPLGFLFAVKASRFITHMKKLREPETAVAPFLENIGGLQEKLGPILFQLPPFWNADESRLRELLTFLRQQQILVKPKITFELRNASWQQEPVFDLFRQNNVALCFADWPEISINGPVTADFVYLRRHGPSYMYSSEYSSEQIQDTARCIREWLDVGIEVFVYFNNDAFGLAIKNALQLQDILADDQAR
jgi:uncharacterized protein YecE (DUF72 family)